MLKAKWRPGLGSHLCLSRDFQDVAPCTPEPPCVVANKEFIAFITCSEPCARPQKATQGPVCVTSLDQSDGAVLKAGETGRGRAAEMGRGRHCKELWGRWGRLQPVGQACRLGPRSRSRRRVSYRRGPRSCP